MRQNYVFTGETIDYYVLVNDTDGASDIGNVQLTVGGIPVGLCAPVDIDGNACGASVDAIALSWHI